MKVHLLIRDAQSTALPPIHNVGSIDRSSSPETFSVRIRRTFAASTAFRQRPSISSRRSLAGMELSDARPLTALEDENARLKKLPAERMLDNGS